MSNEDSFLINKFLKLSWVFVALVVLMCLIGVAMLYSAAQGNFDPWAARHFKRFLLGLFLMLSIAVIDIRVWFKYSYYIYGLAVFLLILVEVMGYIGMGAQRWINIGGFNLQPSELMKIAIILVLSRYFHCLHLNNIHKISVLFIPVILTAIPVVLILKQPNLGTATIITFMAVAMFFVAGISIKKFIIAGVLGVSSLPVIWNFMHVYQKKRVLTFLNPEADPLGSGYNIIQSKIAIGSGGITGKGFLEGSQSQLSFLPEKQTDFIFTMLSEEFGFIGGIFLIMLYASIIILGIRMAIQCHSYYGKLMTYGVMTMLFLHIFVNIAMTMGMIPVVGVPLPLLSYGGSNLLAVMIGLGFVLNTQIHEKTHLDRAIA